LICVCSKGVLKNAGNLDMLKFGLENGGHCRSVAHLKTTMNVCSSTSEQVNKATRMGPPWRHTWGRTGHVNERSAKRCQSNFCGFFAFNKMFSSDVFRSVFLPPPWIGYPKSPQQKCRYYALGETGRWQKRSNNAVGAEAR
jgi:hypothetical protein